MKDPVVAAQVALEKVKGDIVSGTLDTLNSKKSNKKSCCRDQVSESYEFNKSVLSAAYEAKGIVVNSKS